MGKFTDHVVERMKANERAVDAQLHAILADAEANFANTPIPMRLICEKCGALHIDEGEFATKPHHTHACQACGMVWRPAVENTVGMQFLPGFKNDA